MTRMLLTAAVLLSLVSWVAAQTSTCMSRCTESHAYFKRSCSSGLYLGQDCGKGGDDFCVTPYSRCSDGICACLPNFMPKNVTVGKPAMCVPEPSGPPVEVTMDICRFDKSGDAPETATIVSRVAEVTNSDWLTLTMPSAEAVCPVGCSPDSSPTTLFVTKLSKSADAIVSEARKLQRATKKSRSKRRAARTLRAKRQAGTEPAPWILPPTVVSECRIGQVCFQIGPSAYGICRQAQCPVGKAAANDCVHGDDATCPAGYYCHNSGGKVFDSLTRKSKEATMCCPSVCDSGYYRNGRCFQDTNCLDSIDDCEDRCEFEPCRFMVNPCENYGTCFVPKGPEPKYFWCQCVPGKTGRVCEQDGISINRPTPERRIPCEDSLCMPSRFNRPAPIPSLPNPAAAKAIAAQNPFFPSPPVAPVRPVSGSPPKPALACRENKLSNCETLAFRGDCDSNRAHMVANCDCACTKLILYGRNALKPNLG